MVKCSCRHDRLVIRFIHFSPRSDLSNSNTNFLQMTSISLAVWEQSPSFWNLYVLIKKAIGRVPIIQSRLHRNSCHSNLDISGCEAAWDISAAGVRHHFQTVWLINTIFYVLHAWRICPLNFMSLIVVSVIIFLYFGSSKSSSFSSYPKATFLSSRLILFRMISWCWNRFFPPFFCTIWAWPWTFAILINKANNRQQNLFLPSKIDFFSAQVLILRKLCFKNDQHPWTSSAWAGLHIKYIFFFFVNADGIERVLLPHNGSLSMSRFLKQSFVACNMVAASRSHFPDYSLIIQCMAPCFDLEHILTVRLTWVLYCMYEPVSKHHSSSLWLQRFPLHFLFQNRVPVYQLVCVLTCCHVILFSVCKKVVGFYPLYPLYLEFHRRVNIIGL